jgi:MFS family permease
VSNPLARRTLALLTLAYTFNFLDRTLIYILFTPIKAELGLGELQLALLGSTSFVLFYTLLGVPFGRLADRVNRVHMIAAGLTLWSVASGLTGFMDSFAGLFICRVLVGVGEATLGPAAISLLADSFPADRRANANAIYAAGVPLGAALAMFGGGAAGQAWGWRGAFFALGFPGVLLAIVLLLAVREPARGSFPSAPVADAAAKRSGWRNIVSNPVIQLHTAGYACFALAANAVSMWMPGLLGARFQLSLAEVGTALGVCTLLGGGAAAAFGGRAADAWRKRTPGGRLRFGAAAAALAAPLWVGLLMAPSFPLAVACLLPLLAVALAWIGPAAADLTELVQPGDRGVAVGIYFLGVNAVGYGLGPPFLGWLAEQAGSATDPTRVGVAMFVCPVACCVAAGLLLAAARRREAGGSAHAEARPVQPETREVLS